jgi:hypothetical protein
VARALATLQDRGLIRVQREETGGRVAERWSTVQGAKEAKEGGEAPEPAPPSSSSSLPSHRSEDEEPELAAAPSPNSLPSQSAEETDAQSGAPTPGGLADGVEEALQRFGWEPTDNVEVPDESEDGSTDGPIVGGARECDPEVLVAIAEADPPVAAAGTHDGPQPCQLRLDEEAISGAQTVCGRPESTGAESAPDAAEVGARLRPPGSAPPRVPEADRATGGGDDACPDCGGRLLHWEFGDVCTHCHRRFARGGAGS